MKATLGVGISVLSALAAQGKDFDRTELNAMLGRLAVLPEPKGELGASAMCYVMRPPESENYTNICSTCGAKTVYPQDLGTRRERMRKLRDGVVELKAKGLNISLDDSCLCATCRGEKNATEGKPEWFNELKWTIAGRKIEVRPSDVEVLTAFISGRRFLEYDDYKEPVKRYLLRLKELLAGYSDKKENRK